jgi:acetaldehyde dehydrogenase/alcohol dehydrogenase
MWFFNSPRIVFGEESISWLRSITGTRAFIVTDENIVRLGFVHQVMEELAAAGIESEYYSGIEPDPSIDTVLRCAQAMGKYSPDLVIGWAGVMPDAAKGAWFLYERPDIELEAITPFELFGLRSRARLITIPTTSGTGADVSWGFSLADKENHGKLVRVSYELIPDLSIVDPSFTLGLSPQSTADTGMDVLSHAIEAYTCTYHNDFADGLALKAIQLVFDYLPKAYQDGSDKFARERMHNAATIAGLAFSNTAIMLAHALAHGLSGSFSLPHGRLVGLFTPYTIEYNSSIIGDRYGTFPAIQDCPIRFLPDGLHVGSSHP